MSQAPQESGNRQIKTTHVTILTNTIALILLTGSVAAAGEIRFSPRCSTGQEYYHKKYDGGEGEHDYLTTLSAGFGAGMRDEHRQFNIAWDPRYSHYKRETGNNTLRQKLSLTGEAALAKRTTFSIHELFVYTEEEAFDAADPMERRKRETFSTNHAEIRAVHRFGTSNSLNLGYENTLEENQDEDLEDTLTHKPSVNLDYWFTFRSNLKIDVNYIRSEFDTHHTDSHDQSIRFTRRFSGRTGAFVRYTHNRVESEGPSGRYDIHNPSLGISHTFRNDLFVSTGVGLRLMEPDHGPGHSELSFDQVVTKKWSGRRGEVNLRGATGYENNYTDTDNEGISRFAEGECTALYQVVKSTGVRFSSLLKYNENEGTDEKEARGTLGAGVRYAPTKKISVRCDYGFGCMKSTDDSDEYDEHRYSAGLTHTPLKWLQLHGRASYKKVIADLKTNSYEESRVVLDVKMFFNYKL